MEEPKIGIVIVNYNAEKYQNDAIRSIKAMDYSNYEIIEVLKQWIIQIMK